MYFVYSVSVDQALTSTIYVSVTKSKAVKIESDPFYRQTREFLMLSCSCSSMKVLQHLLIQYFEVSAFVCINYLLKFFVFSLFYHLSDIIWEDDKFWNCCFFSEKFLKWEETLFNMPTTYHSTPTPTLVNLCKKVCLLTSQISHW